MTIEIENRNNPKWWREKTLSINKQKEERWKIWKITEEALEEDLSEGSGNGRFADLYLSK